jgi:hypothetical protein
MTKRVLGVLAALAMMGGSAVACSSSSNPAPAPGSDAGKDAVTDTKTDAGKDVTPIDSAPPADKTTGKPCATNDECDVTGEAVNVCTKGAFGGDSLYPTNVCIGTSCDVGDGTKVMYCDGDTGVCLKSGTSNICLPLCSWKDDGTAPTGCAGENACNPYAWGQDDTTKATVGIGYCFGGCKTDADCEDAGANKCETKTGLCVRTPDTYTKNIGDACTDADVKQTGSACNCLYATNLAGTKSGYCSQFCKVGDTGACASGYTCDSMLPKTKIAPDDIVFTTAPTGMAGYCLKNCATDADCPNNGYCDENAGTGQKTCQVGLRPCMDNTQCAAGGTTTTTCQGATATSYGRCK